jgi:hypothetical protein
MILDSFNLLPEDCNDSYTPRSACSIDALTFFMVGWCVVCGWLLLGS